MIGIYKIENLINGKVYIGQSVNIKERWNEHKLINSRTSKDALKKQKYPLYLAFQKYGLENFSFEVLEECSLEDLDTKEQFYIKKYNSYVDFLILIVTISHLAEMEIKKQQKKKF